MTTLFLKNFTVLDFAFHDVNFGPRGESWMVSVELEGSLDEKGFIFDFGPAKKIIKAFIDEYFDHKLLVPECEKKTVMSYYLAPTSTFCFLSESITKSLVESEMAKQILPLLPKNISKVRFYLSDDPRFQYEANFRYTHGLRFHEGNCQRLMHGHRNPIEIWINSQRSMKWESWLAELWADIHFANEKTVTNREQLDLPLHKRVQRSDLACLFYQAPQGDFSLTLPMSRLFLLSEEPSIENIAQCASTLLREQGVKGKIRIIAYEGLNKGASFDCENY